MQPQTVSFNESGLLFSGNYGNGCPPPPGNVSFNESSSSSSSSDFETKINYIGQLPSEVLMNKICKLLSCSEVVYLLRCSHSLYNSTEKLLWEYLFEKEVPVVYTVLSKQLIYKLLKQRPAQILQELRKGKLFTAIDKCLVSVAQCFLEPPSSRVLWSSAFKQLDRSCENFASGGEKPTADYAKQLAVDVITAQETLQKKQFVALLKKPQIISSIVLVTAIVLGLLASPPSRY